MVMDALQDIVCDLYPNIKELYVNGSTIAGALVYISEANGVTMCNAPSTVPVGVALQNVADNHYVGVAMPPTTVWLRISNTTQLSAGDWVMPNGTIIGTVENFSGGTTNSNALVGIVQTFYPTNTSIVKVQLMCVPCNASRL